MRISAVDIGNTFLKVTPFEEGLPSGEAKICSGPGEAIEACRRFGSRHVVYCTTRALTDEEQDLFRGEGWWQFKHGCALPLRVDYSSPQTLGANRVAGAVGAWSLFPGQNLLVADAGTALTLDFVESEGVFRGGNICPGLRMRLRSLHEHTSLLPEVDADGEWGLLGHDTETAIRSGAFMGIVNDIAGTLREVERKYGCGRVVLTGGDAPRIEGALREALDGEAKIEPVSWLVQKGLIEVYRYNNENK